jgi:hypothetical protein
LFITDAFNYLREKGKYSPIPSFQWATSERSLRSEGVMESPFLLEITNIFHLALDEEGIFRVSGTKREVMEFKDRIDKGSVSSYSRNPLSNVYFYLR